MSLSKLSEKLYPVFIQSFNEKFSNPCRLFLAASSLKERATVRHAICNTPEEAWTMALVALKEALSQKEVEPVILRADWVTSSESKTWAQCLELIGSKRRNWFRQGIALDKNYHLAFTEQELNANLIFCNLDKEKPKGEFQLDKAQVYCQKRFNCNFPQMLDTDEVEIFNTEGAFIEEGMPTPLTITGKGINIGRRDFAPNNSEVFFKMAMNSANFLVKQCGTDGKFIYGLYPCDDTTIPRYNTHRHFGTLFSMAEAYEVCAEGQAKQALGTAIENGLEYGIRNLLHYKDNSSGKDTAYFSEGRGTTIGISGLALLAFTKWTTVSGTKKYISLMQALARGIIAVQKPEGNFIQALNISDFSVRKEFVIPFYDGEALFGMLRLYAITKEPELLDSVERAVHYFYNSNYAENHDHWMQYTLNELTIYKPKEEYFNFGLDNILNYLPKIFVSAGHAPTQLEMIMAAENMIRRMNSLPKMAELLKRVDFEKFYSTADRRAERLRNSYFWSEVAMYFKNPQRIIDGFFVRADAFRVRIDDIQHTISGLLAYDRCFKGESVKLEPVKDDMSIVKRVPQVKVETPKSVIENVDAAQINRTVIKAGSVRVTIETQDNDAIELEGSPAQFAAADKNPLLRVGILRKTNPTIWAPDSPSFTAFYMSKSFNIELFLFTPQDIDFVEKTVKATTLQGTKKIQMVIPLPRIIDNPASILSGKYAKELRPLAREYFFTRSPMNASKQNIYNMLLKDGRFKEFLIDTHLIENFEHFLTLSAQYNNDVILKPSGGNEGKGVVRITFKGGNCLINIMKTTITLHSLGELQKFYDEHFSGVNYVLQPYVTSRTHQGNPFDIRIHTRRGAGGKFKVLPYPRIGNENGVVSNVGSGGYTMKLDTFLKVEFGEDWEILYNKILTLGNTFPEYYQSFYNAPLFDVGIDVGIQRQENAYELKIFEVNTYCGGSFVRVEDAVIRFEYYRYIDKKIREGDT